MKPCFLIPLCDYTILLVKAYERIKLTVTLLIEYFKPLLFAAPSGDRSLIVGFMWDGICHGSVVPPEVCGDVWIQYPHRPDRWGGCPRTPCLHCKDPPLQ